MGRRGKGWFRAFKRVFRLESKEKKDQKSKILDLGRAEHSDALSVEIVPTSSSDVVFLPPTSAPPLPNSEEGKFVESELEQNNNGYSVANSSNSAAQVVEFNTLMNSTDESTEEGAAIKIQTAFRGYLMSENWDDSTQSKEQIEAGLLSKQEASIRRERALAYAFSHQWKNSAKSVNPTFMDPNNPHWGWSWLERWMSARPWEGRSNTTDREQPYSDRASTKSTNGGDIIKAYARRESSLNGTVVASPQKSTRPLGRQSPATPHSKATGGASKMRSASPKSNWAPLDDDTRSMISTQSERPRRHSIAGSSVRDDESLAGSSAVPSYMAPTRSARAKARTPSPSTNSKIETTPEKGSVGSVKKKLSFPNSPAVVRRHSGPPMVDVCVVQEEDIVSAEQNEANLENR